MENLWFESWESIIRTLCLTILGYAAMLILLRISGKRALSQMNAFDLIITITLGSILASLALSKDLSFADGLTSIVILIGLQFLLSWLSVRVRAVEKIITSPPTLLFYKGQFLHKAMKDERITLEEINGIGRQKRYSTLDEIDMIILEPAGELTIIENIKNGNNITYTNIEGHTPSLER